MRGLVQLAVALSFFSVFCFLSTGAAQQVVTPPPAPTDVAVHAGTDGFSIGTTDRSWVLKLSLGAQVELREYLTGDPSGASSSFFLRRVRPRLEGTLFRVLDYLLQAELGGEGRVALDDLWVNLRIAPWLQVRVGKQKVPFGVERLQSFGNVLMIERGFPSRIAPNHDLGVTIWGTLADGAINGWLGVFNGNPDGTITDSDTDDAKDFAARLFFHPLRPTGIAALHDLGIGGAVTYGIERGTPTQPGVTDPTLAAVPSYGDSSRATFFSYRGASSGTTPTAQVRADGERLRFGVDAYWYWDRLTLFGEANWSRQTFVAPSTARFTDVEAWSAQGQAGVLLTDDSAHYDGVRPRKPFDPWEHGEWGALELTARFQELHVSSNAFHEVADPSRSARIARELAAGFNWHLTYQLKLQVNYAHVFYEGGAAGGNRPDEDALLFLLQVRT